MISQARAKATARTSKAVSPREQKASKGKEIQEKVKACNASHVDDMDIEPQSVLLHLHIPRST